MVKDLFQINQAALPSTYLGAPLFLGCARHSFFKRIIDFIRTRLAGWKSKLLSLAGGLILIKHVLSSIPIHISLIIPLPSKTCLLIQRLMRNFLWSSDPDRLGNNFVIWETICLPKSEGDLGLRRLKEFNDACFMKLAWSIATGISLWA